MHASMRMQHRTNDRRTPWRQALRHATAAGGATQQRARRAAAALRRAARRGARRRRGHSAGMGPCRLL
eukprot:2654684-Prymnesium_polylepis.1